MNSDFSKKLMELNTNNAFLKYFFKKLTELLNNNVFIKYLTYASISLFLGILIKFKVCDEIFILINSFIYTLTNVLGLNEYILILNESNYSSLFSTSAAILSTLFTLVFVLSTLYVQMLNKFTSLNIFSTKETKFLMGTYFGTIILSLIMLETNYQCPTLILIMTVFCVLSIYPFMQSVNSKLMYSGIKKLLIEIKISINTNEEPRAISILDELKELHKSITNVIHIGSFIKAMIYCDNICMIAKDHQMKEVVSRIGYHYFDIMSILMGNNLELKQINERTKFVLSSIENYTRNYSEIIDYVDLYGQVVFLSTNGTNLIKNNVKDSSIKIVADCLYNNFSIMQKKRVVGEVIEKNINDLEMSIIEYIGELARESLDKKLNLTVNTAIMFLWKIGAEITWGTYKKECRSSPILFTVVDQLKKIEDSTGDVLFKRIFEYSKSEISNNQEIKSCLNDFNKFYYNAKDAALEDIEIL